MKTITLITLLFSSQLVSAQIWDNVIENVDTTGTISLVGASWNNTLIKNCTIHNTGSGNDGIFLRDVQNVKIENCTIYDIDGQGGIRLSISGNGTDSVIIMNNTLYNLQENGINAPQRSQNSTPLNQDNLIIEGNTIYNSGLGSSSGLHHAIYCQAADFSIANNTIFGVRDGNGISVRSSGKISGNIISGESKANKPAIRYFSDHFTGNSDSLIVENNIIYNDSSSAHTLDIFDFANLYQNSISDNHIVKNFNIRFNTIISLQSNKFGVQISNDYNQIGYSTIVEGNIIINTNSLSQCISVPTNTVQLYNLIQDNLSNFSSDLQPFDFHILDSHSAINYVGNSSSNYPVYDIDGDLRSGNLDAGADEYTATTGINVLNHQSEYKIYPNPLVLGESIKIEGDQNISNIVIFKSNGQEVFNEKIDLTSNRTTLDLPEVNEGMYFLQINNAVTIPFIINK